MGILTADLPLGLVTPGANERAALRTPLPISKLNQGQILDIFLTNSTCLIKSISVIPGLSDRDGMLIVDSDIDFNRLKPRKALLMLFKKADKIGTVFKILY